MKLSMDIIAHELTNYTDITFLKHAGSESLCLTGCEFWDVNAVKHYDTLYLISPDVSFTCLSEAKDLCLVVIGKIPKHIQKNNLVIELPSATPILPMMNTLNRIFMRYQKLEQDLISAVYDKGDLKKMIQLITPFLVNEVIVMNSDFYIMAQSYDRIKLCDISNINQDPNSGMIPTEVADFFRNDSIYQSVATSREPFYYYPSVFSATVYCENIFVQNEYAARVVLSEIDKKIESCDEQLFHFFSSYVQRLYSLFNLTAKNDMTDSMSHAMLKLLNKESLAASDLTLTMNLHHWSDQDTYLCFCVLPGSSSNEGLTLPYYCAKISSQFTDTCTVEFNNLIIGLVNLRTYNNSEQSFRTSFNLFQREANFRVGYSNLFHNIMDLKNYELEAEIALSIGLKQNPTRWYHRFTEYVFFYLKQKMTEELSGDFLLSNEVAALHEYDKQNNTEYIKTLHCYLNNNLNAVQTAENLFIHRATMVYRIKRMQQIAGIDFNNNDQILYIRLSLRFFLDATTEIC